MRCTQASHQLQLYIDHRLTVEKTRKLEAHIASCPACRQELELLEEITTSLHNLKPVIEPPDMTAQIMQRIAFSPRRNAPRFSLLRPSLPELLAVIILATITTIGSILSQPSIRTLLPFAHGHDPLSQAFLNAIHLLITFDSSTLIFAFWIIGTLLGICITLILAGNEVRTGWYKAMLERLPVR